VTEPRIGTVWTAPELVPTQPSVVAIGVFDGVHVGHRATLSTARRLADERGCRAVALTFDPHPARVVAPSTAPLLLMTPQRRARTIIGEQGFDGVLLLPFDDDRARQAPEAFVRELLLGQLGAVEVVVGRGFRFGHRAGGTCDTLREVGEPAGMHVTAVDLVHDEAVLSSTRIRQLVAEGVVELATGALGRPFILDGTVIDGDRRGRTIGFPTANLAVDDTLVQPAIGVYAGRLLVGGEALPAVINIGRRPTFGPGEVLVEVHCLDWSGDLYGREVAVTFEHSLRGEVKFDGVDALVAQISADVAQARALLV